MTIHYTMVQEVKVYILTKFSPVEEENGITRNNLKEATKSRRKRK